MFPNSIVYQVPFATEDPTIPVMGEAPENALSVDEQKAKLAAAGDDTSRFDFSFVQDHPGECGYFAARNDYVNNPRCVSDLEHLINVWLPNMLAGNTAPAAIQAKIAAGETVRVALVSHGDLIKRQLLSDPAAVASDVDVTSSVTNNRGLQATFSLIESQAPSQSTSTSTSVAANNAGTAETSSWGLVRKTLWENVPGDAAGVPMQCSNSDPASFYERCTLDNPNAWASFKQTCLTTTTTTTAV